MYRGVDVLVINKMDLLPYVPFRMDFFQRGVEALNPGLKIFPLSCRTGEGIDEWISWLQGEVLAFRANPPQS
jgi:hydrogenase nickel incorporation protein HypB